MNEWLHDFLYYTTKQEGVCMGKITAIATAWCVSAAAAATVSGLPFPPPPTPPLTVWLTLWNTFIFTWQGDIVPIVATTCETLCGCPPYLLHSPQRDVKTPSAAAAPPSPLRLWLTWILNGLPHSWPVPCLLVPSPSSSQCPYEWLVSLPIPRLVYASELFESTYSFWELEEDIVAFKDIVYCWIEFPVKVLHLCLGAYIVALLISLLWTLFSFHSLVLLSCSKLICVLENGWVFMQVTQQM